NDILILSIETSLLAISVQRARLNNENTSMEINHNMAVICKKCGLPNDLCACGELDKEETRIVIRLETRRFSKTTTMIEGIDPKLSDIQHIVKELKSKLACGGTAKDGFILLQGDHREDVKSYLVKFGFTESAIEVQ
ncbi:MAG TPA: translation initiation factor, partial [Nitrososphaeraceae archaeon]|nr:translation initiation factor [Nitrososphaeraceae archaeon]